MMNASEAQAYCTAYTNKSGSNFYYSFLFLPRTKRDAMYTVYAFCKAVDSAVDEPAAGSNPKANSSAGAKSLTWCIPAFQLLPSW
jgi:phytoene synthase